MSTETPISIIAEKRKFSAKKKAGIREQGLAIRD
jgi:hypothetical protein